MDLTAVFHLTIRAFSSPHLTGNANFRSCLQLVVQHHDAVDSWKLRPQLLRETLAPAFFCVGRLRSWQSRNVHTGTVEASALFWFISRSLSMKIGTGSFLLLLFTVNHFSVRAIAFSSFLTTAWGCYSHSTINTSRTLPSHVSKAVCTRQGFPEFTCPLRFLQFLSFFVLPFVWPCSSCFDCSMANLTVFPATDRQ